MKVAIAINGEGRGHLARAWAVAEGLIGRHDVLFLAPKHLSAELSLAFPPANVVVIPYLAFEQRGFRLDYPRTVARNAVLVARMAIESRALAASLRDFGIDAVLSDFEPISVRAARIAGIPALQLNHPGIVTRVRDPGLEALAARAVAGYMAGKPDRTVICSFFAGDVGPILRSELRERLRGSAVTRGDYVIAYRKESYGAELDAALALAGSLRVRRFPNPEDDYPAALAGCAAVIAPAGHQSISEALAFGKPAFVVPVEGQYEQALNARMLRASGFGDYASARELGARLPIFLGKLDGFVSAIDAYRANPSAYPGWRCLDETDRAVGMVESFLRGVGASAIDFALSRAKEAV